MFRKIEFNDRMEKVTDVVNFLVGMIGESVYASEHGAVGDGATDDTTAIQNAINESLEKKVYQVYFEAGIYKVTGTLQNYSQVRFLGADVTFIGGDYKADNIKDVILTMNGDVGDIDGGTFMETPRGATIDGGLFTNNTNTESEVDGGEF